VLSGDARFRFGIEKKNCTFFVTLIKLLFDLPLLEHHNLRPFGVNALNGESIIRYPFFLPGLIFVLESLPFRKLSKLLTNLSFARRLSGQALL
jgi:hypothetical protein